MPGSRRARLTLRSRLAAAAEDQRGAMSIEAVLILPVVLTIIFMIISGAIWFSAGNLAQAAAASAYNTARLYNATSQDGTQAGYAIANQPGTILENAQVTVTRTATTVTVEVTGNSPTIIPGLNVAVDRTVTGPTEHWVGG